jgi:hypothetical protein
MDIEKINLLYVKIRSLQLELDQTTTLVAQKEEIIAQLKLELDLCKK